jgi:hypothetical protein
MLRRLRASQRPSLSCDGRPTAGATRTGAGSTRPRKTYCARILCSRIHTPSAALSLSRLKQSTSSCSSSVMSVVSRLPSAILELSRDQGDAWGGPSGPIAAACSSWSDVGISPYRLSAALPDCTVSASLRNSGELAERLRVRERSRWANSYQVPYPMSRILRTACSSCCVLLFCAGRQARSCASGSGRCLREAAARSGSALHGRPPYPRCRNASSLGSNRRPRPVPLSEHRPRCQPRKSISAQERPGRPSCQKLLKRAAKWVYLPAAACPHTV